jgi:small-conductance mechanosensitive channel
MHTLCYNRPMLVTRDLLQGWRDDLLGFVRFDLPKILLIVLISLLLIRILAVVTRKISSLHAQHILGGLRTQQVGTLAGIINGVGSAVIFLICLLEVLSLLGLSLGPLLASAGIAGLAIGFGAQTLVRDVMNGFFILLEDHFDIGDTIRTAGVEGAVERMSLRRTVLRDGDGTIHFIPNSQITLVSNMSRDWAQIPFKVTVAYDESSDKVISLMQRVGEDVRHDPAFSADIIGDIQVPGIERVGNGEAEYLMLVKTRPNKQDGVCYELQRRFKQTFATNNVRTPGPGRVFVVDQSGPSR